MKDAVYWFKMSPPQPAEPLQADMSVDAVVVGGGMAGLTAAEHLARQGMSVALLEKDFCGAGASGKSSGFITPDSELELSDLIGSYGPEHAGRLWAFAESGVRLIRDTIQAHGLECDYQAQDSLFAAASTRGARVVRREHEARQRLGYSSELYESPARLGAVIGTKEYHHAVRYRDTFGMNSYLYCQGMRTVLREHGVRIHEGTAVTAIRRDGVIAGTHRVRAKHIIVCADRFIPALGRLQNAISQMQTFLTVSSPLSQEQVRAVFPDGPLMVWDTKLIYNYFRLTGDRRILLGGANLFSTYAKKEHHHPSHMVRRLADYWEKLFPDVEVQWEYLWPGMLGVSKDFLPVAGADRAQPSVHYIGAAAGLPWAAALARYTAQKIAGSPGELDAFFSPYRKVPPLPFALAHGLSKIRRFF